MLRALALPLSRSLLALESSAPGACNILCSLPVASSSTRHAFAGAAAAPLSTSSSATAAAAAGGSADSSPPSSSSSSSSAGARWLGSSTWSRPRARHAPHANAPLAAPWVFTSQLSKRKTYQKRSRFMIQALEAEQQRQLGEGKQLPRFSAGDILEVTTIVPEAERRAYTYKGVCIARANRGPRSWFKLYNVFPDAGGFVQHFPLYMPDLLSVRVVGRLPRAKRNRLYHLLQDESPKHIYQTSVGVGEAATQ